MKARVIATGEIIDVQATMIEDYDGEIIKDLSLLENRIFSFPTPEMRDAFKYNFDPDIEICKEFL